MATGIKANREKNLFTKKKVSENFQEASDGIGNLLPKGQILDMKTPNYSM